MKLPTFKSSKGFTLIELLVVIAILAILAAIALTSFNSAQKSGRDARRRSDLEQYRNALQTFATNNAGNFPYLDCPSPTNCNGSNSNTANLLFSANSPIIGTDKILPVVIDDPSNTTTYKYMYYVTSTSQYKLVATMEAEGSATNLLILLTG